MGFKKKMVVGLVSLGLLCFSMAGCSSNSSSTPDTNGKSKPQKVKIMVGGLEKIIYLPAKLTENLGYFKDEGLDVEFTSQASGVSAETSLIAGEVDGVVGFYDHTIDLQSKGQYIESVVQLAGSPGESLVISNKAKEKVKELSDLKGTNIGITGLGSSTNFLATYFVTKGGHSAKDYTPVPVGAGSTLIAAMQQNQISLAVTTEPTVSLLKKQNLGDIFIDMNTPEDTKQALGGQYPAASLYIKPEFAKNHPDTVQHLANAFVKTLKYIQSHSAEEIADKMPQEYYAGDKKLYIEALKHSLPMFTPDGKMPEGGPETVLNVLTSFNPDYKNKNIQLDKTYTNDFVSKAK